VGKTKTNTNAAESTFHVTLVTVKVVFQSWTVDIRSDIKVSRRK